MPLRCGPWGSPRAAPTNGVRWPWQSRTHERIVSVGVQEVGSIRTALTGPQLHHSWTTYLAVVLVSVGLLVLLHGHVAQGVAFA